MSLMAPRQSTDHRPVGLSGDGDRAVSAGVFDGMTLVHPERIGVPSNCLRIVRPRLLASTPRKLHIFPGAAASHTPTGVEEIPSTLNIAFAEK